MELTLAEERILDGEEGYAHQLAMKIVVKLGEIFAADRLIPITSAARSLSLMATKALPTLVRTRFLAKKVPRTAITMIR